MLFGPSTEDCTTVVFSRRIVRLGIEGPPTGRLINPVGLIAQTNSLTDQMSRERLLRC